MAIWSPAHVVEGAIDINATLDEKSYAVEIVGVDKSHDLAVLRIAAKGLTALPLADSEKVELNEDVLAVGFPLSTAVGESIKMSRGIVAGVIKGKDKNGDKMFQIDAAINHGNSGGPVVNTRGHVMGVASAKLVGEDISNIGFAVPSADVARLLDKHNVQYDLSSEGQELQGALLGRRVQPSVAFIMVTIDPRKLEAEKRSVRCNSYYKGEAGGAAGVVGGEGSFVASSKGEITDEKQAVPLPATLGSVADLFVNPLPSDGKTAWQAVRLTSFSQVIATQTAPGARPVPRPPTAFSRSSRSRSRFAPPQSPAPQQPHTSTQTVVFPAIEKITYEIVSFESPIVTIKRHYEFITLSKKEGVKPLLQISSEATLLFDEKLGIAESLAGEGQIDVNEGGGSGSGKFTFGFRRVDPTSLRRPDTNQPLSLPPLQLVGGQSPPPAARSQPKSSGEGESGATAVNSRPFTPPGGMSSAPPRDSKRVRLPAPEGAALRKARSLVDELFTKEVAAATTESKKVELANTLMTQARAEQRDMAARDALLDKARALAMDAANSRLAMSAVDELVNQFDTDGAALRLSVLTGTEAAADKPDEKREFVEMALGAMDDAIKADQYDVARKLGSLALSMSKTLKDTKMTERVLERGKQFKSLQSGYAEAKSGMETLKTSPDDAAANLIVGRFMCMVKGDWDSGLPRLAKSGDESVQSLATKEIAGPRGAEEQLELADGWHDLADSQTGLKKDNLLAHASYWYERAMPSLSGVQRIKAEKRIIVVAKSEPAGSSDKSSGPDAKNSGAAPTTADIKALLKSIAAQVKAGNLVKSPELGATNGTAVAAVPEVGGVLVGIEIIGDTSGITGLRPIFQTDKKPTVPGPVFGNASRNAQVLKVMAKKGYAIGAIHGRAGLWIDGLEITFMEMTATGLNPQKSYKTDWVGGNGGSQEVDLGGNGLPIVGLFGRQNLGSRITSLGVVQCEQPK